MDILRCTVLFMCIFTGLSENVQKIIPARVGDRAVLTWIDESISPNDEIKFIRDEDIIHRKAREETNCSQSENRPTCFYIIDNVQLADEGNYRIVTENKGLDITRSSSRIRLLVIPETCQTDKNTYFVGESIAVSCKSNHALDCVCSPSQASVNESRPEMNGETIVCVLGTEVTVRCSGPPMSTIPNNTPTISTWTKVGPHDSEDVAKASSGSSSKEKNNDRGTNIFIFTEDEKSSLIVIIFLVGLAIIGVIILGLIYIHKSIQNNLNRINFQPVNKIETTQV
ncbi:uncharacterized protein LOC117122851 [Anneissia japonica]|uniref:uncharacterized protein LOC117122851 n=1 Tax=Anneissia japonica TaxID=1529436 RepID=UPI001425A80A|nr:uncharacterized protein LOC117122851 [Anneissia japonica]